MAALGEDLSEEDIENMVKEADQDGDNRIDFNGEYDSSDCRVLWK